MNAPLSPTTGNLLAQNPKFNGLLKSFKIEDGVLKIEGQGECTALEIQKNPNGSVTIAIADHKDIEPINEDAKTADLVQWRKDKFVPNLHPQCQSITLPDSGLIDRIDISGCRTVRVEGDPTDKTKDYKKRAWDLSINGLDSDQLDTVLNDLNLGRLDIKSGDKSDYLFVDNVTTSGASIDAGQGIDSASIYGKSTISFNNQSSLESISFNPNI
jgi:hypothetical protein